MPVYLVIHSTITDPEKMKAYREQARGTIPPEGVRLIAMDDALETLEGEAPHQRLVIIEFDSKERLKDWYDSPEYKAARQFRIDGTEGFAVVAEGARQG